MRLLLAARLVALSVPFVTAQVPRDWEIKISPENPKAGDKVVLEIEGLRKSPGLEIDWRKEKGDGVFVDDKTSGMPIAFIPSKPGDLIVIVCDLSGGLSKTIKKEFRVNGKDAPAPPAPQPQPPKPARRIPTPATERLPSDAVPLEDIVQSDEFFIAPAGWMGDALTAGAMEFVGAQGCKFDVGCVSLRYDVTKRKEGFVALAWQVIPQGQKYNWGEHKGIDLSAKGYQSLRVYAKADSDSKALPKVEFKAGGNIDPKYASMHPNPATVSTGSKSLTDDWQMFCMNLKTALIKDLVSPLTVVIDAAKNPNTQLGLFIDGAHFSKAACGK